MAVSLGAEVTVCGPFGGEVGSILGTMLAEEKLKDEKLDNEEGFDGDDDEDDED